DCAAVASAAGAMNASSARGACDAAARGNANRFLDRYNADLQRRDAGDGRRRDRLDWGITMFATPGAGGGQSCWSGQRVAGIGIDTDGQAQGSLMAQEVLHCMGEVPRSSPNSDGGAHSRNGLIPLYRYTPMVNFISRNDYLAIPSVMYPWFVPRA